MDVPRAEPPATRSPDPVRTRAEILDVATGEFARRGFGGARVDEIAALTRTTKRMIYYYFGGKEQLYVAVLQRAFAGLRPPVPSVEDVERDPLGAVVRIAGLTYDRYRAHPDFGRLLIAENLTGGAHLAAPALEQPATSATAPSATAGAATALDRLERALAAGVRQRLIRPGVEAGDLLMLIDSLCQFAVANRHTHRRVSGDDPLGEAFGGTGRRVLTDVVTAYLAPRADGS